MKRVSCKLRVVHLRGGRYEVLQAIASGGMATVHLGRALGAGGFERLVAIKVMHPHIASEPEFVTMFLDEARLAAQIRHPNVVSTIDVQQDAGGVLLVMEYVEGPSLHIILRTIRKSGLDSPLPILLRIYLDALAGLHAAHELTGEGGEPLRLVHRDVSPQNILVGVDGIARITDFGVARAESRLSTTKIGELKGKIAYMAPEQVKSMPIDRRTDVYSAGALLWEILASRILVQADTELGMLSKILCGGHPPPGSVAPSVPPALEAACMRALGPELQDRYDTVAAFAEAIEAAARADGVSLAAPRDVAAYVKELNVHTAPGNLTPTSMSLTSEDQGPFSPISSRGRAWSSDGTDDLPLSTPDLDFSSPAPSPNGIEPPSSPPPSSVPLSASDVPSVLSSPPPAAGRRSGRGLLLGLGAGAVLASAGWLVAGRGSDNARTELASNALSSPSIKSSLAVMAAPPPPAVDAPDASVSGSVAPGNAASSASAASEPKVEDRASAADAKGAKGAPKKNKGSRKASGAATAGHNPPSFRPKEL